MPHVVIVGNVTARAVADRFAHFQQREGNRIIKTVQHYLSGEGSELLVEAIVIEGGPPSRLFVSVQDRGDGVVVRLHPVSDQIEKTDCVKRLLAHIGVSIMAAFDDRGLSVGKTNLQPFLQDLVND